MAEALGASANAVEVIRADPADLPGSARERPLRHPDRPRSAHSAGDVAAAVQHTAAEEAVLVQRLSIDVPAADLPELVSATGTWAQRRDARHRSAG